LEITLKYNRINLIHNLRIIKKYRHNKRLKKMN